MAKLNKLFIRYAYSPGSASISKGAIEAFMRQYRI